MRLLATFSTYRLYQYPQFQSAPIYFVIHVLGGTPVFKSKDVKEVFKFLLKL